MARRALDHLKTLNAGVMGVVLNDADLSVAPSAYMAPEAERMGAVPRGHDLPLRHRPTPETSIIWPVTSARALPNRSTPTLSEE